MASAGVVGLDMQEVRLRKARQVLRTVGRLVGRVVLWVPGTSVFSCRAGASAGVLGWAMEMRVGSDVGKAG